MSIVLEGKIREASGKGGARQIRRDAGLPAVIYGLDDNINIQVPSKPFHKLIKAKGKNILIDLEIEGDSKKQRKVMVKEYQTHPLEDDWLHVDFLELDMNKKITAHVPVILIGHSPGEKQGGLVNHAAHSLDIECLPGDILSSIEVDMTKVLLDQVLHVSDLTVSDKVHILNQPGEVVVSVYVDKAKSTDTAEGEEEEAATEGEVAKTDGDDKK